MNGFIFKARKQTTGTRHNTRRPQMMQPFSRLKRGTCKGRRKTALLDFFDEKLIQKTQPELVMGPPAPSPAEPSDLV